MRLNSERRLGDRYISSRVSDVPCPRWLVDRPRLDPEQRCELPEDLVKTDRLPGRHVEDPSADARCVGRPQIRFDDVADVDEIARLPPVAIHDRWLAPSQGFEEARDDRRIRGMGILTRTKYVEVPQSTRLQTVDASEDGT